MRMAEWDALALGVAPVSKSTNMVALDAIPRRRAAHHGAPPASLLEVYGHGDIGALEEVDRAFAGNVVQLRRIEDAGKAG
jgi:hypothetical protein